MGYDKMIFGNDFSVTMDSNVTQTNNNVIVVGTSGCGKLQRQIFCIRKNQV